MWCVCVSVMGKIYPMMAKNSRNVVENIWMYTVLKAVFTVPINIDTDGNVKFNSYRGKDNSLVCVIINSFKHQHELEKLNWHSVYVHLMLSVHETKMLLNLKTRMRCTTSIVSAYYELLQGITSVNYLTPCSRFIQATSIAA